MTGLLFIDLNEFKKINDTHGHGAGDKLLIAVAQRIQNSLRETDLVARLGGDEFVVVLEDVNSPEEITRIAHKLSHAIEQPLYVRQLILKFSASIGVAIFPIDGRQKQELEEKADRAMYLAKKRGLPVALASLESANVPTPGHAAGEPDLATANCVASFTGAASPAVWDCCPPPDPAVHPASSVTGPRYSALHTCSRALVYGHPCSPRSFLLGCLRPDKNSRGTQTTSATS